ncbi:MAG TPA: PAS domain S-box protein [Methanotrichaceae archaeon]|nr:PAS domain S-box protein [Methanotrichaceae archaeon]
MAAIAVLIHLALGLWLRDDIQMHITLSDLYIPLPNLLAVAGLLYAARRSASYGKNVRTAWILLAVSESFSTLANIAYAVFEIGTSQPPFPSAADVFYLLEYPFFLAGVLLLPAAALTRTDRTKILIEMGIVMISALLGFWVFLIEPTIQASHASALTLDLSLLYPVLDLLMFFAVIELLFRRLGSSNRGSLYLLAASMGVLIASDLLYSLEFLRGTYVSGGLSDSGYVLGYALIWLAGVSQGIGQEDAAAAHPDSGARQHSLSYLPYLGALGAYSLLIWSHDHYYLPITFPVLAWAMGGIIGLLLLRQIVALKENSDLYIEARQEIAERERAEIAMIESERRYHTVVEQASEIIFLADAGTYRILDCNLAFKDLMGYANEEISSLILFDVVAHDRESIEQNLLALREQGHCFLTGRKYRKKDGSLIDVEININRMAYGGREVYCVVARDVTERLRSEEALRMSEARYRSLFDGVPVGLFRMLSTGGLVDANQSMVEMLRYPDKESLLAADVSSLYADCQEKRHWQKLMERDGMVRSFQEKMKCRDGTDLWVEVSSRIVRDAQGRAICYEGSLQDITERRLADEARQESEGRFRTIFETTLSYIIIKDKEGRYVQINPAMERRVGMSSSDAAGKTDVDLFGPEIGEYIAEVDSRVVQGDVIEDDISLPIGDDQVIFHYVKAPMRDSSGRICGLYGIAQDMTAHMKDKERLTASLLEKEVLLREVHHRVKNNLQIISSLLSIQSRYLPDDQTSEMLNECRGRVRSMSLIHENLYKSENLARVNFAQYIRSLVMYIRQSFGDGARGINIRLDLDETFLNIDYAIPCGLIVNELVSNSLKHAFPDHRAGRISIELRSSKDGSVYLSVQDDGVGIPQSPEMGTPKSMGLQLVAALAKQIKATLEIDGHDGTSFKIAFAVPVSEVLEKESVPKGGTTGRGTQSGLSCTSIATK